MNEILKMIAITFIPTLELRASIPYGIFGTDSHWLMVFIVCVIANFIIGIMIFIFLDWIIKIMCFFKPVETLWNRYIERTQKRISEGVEKYGEWAVAVFIGIPLPGSGVYTGALASFLIGLSFKKFIVANIIGVLIAGILVTIICLTGSGLANIFIKQV
ncbi:MAG: small multi-drug export protein [Candidatus Marinimicrobia bacterium]|nr:small multi-drug export protein [Candidatus Neomarinimicrobiota bacterium]